MHKEIIYSLQTIHTSLFYHLKKHKESEHKYHKNK